MDSDVAPLDSGARFIKACDVHFLPLADIAERPFLTQSGGRQPPKEKNPIEAGYTIRANCVTQPARNEKDPPRSKRYLVAGVGFEPTFATLWDATSPLCHPAATGYRKLASGFTQARPDRSSDSRPIVHPASTQPQRMSQLVDG